MAVERAKWGEWWISVDDGEFKMGHGRSDNPSVTFITSDKDWVAMSNGKLKSTWTYTTRRLKVLGSQSIARKLDETSLRTSLGD